MMRMWMLMMRMWMLMMRMWNVDADDVKSDDGDHAVIMISSGQQRVSLIVRCIGGPSCAENDVSDDEDASEI